MIAARLVLSFILSLALLAGTSEAAKKKSQARPLLRWEQPMKVVIVRSSEKGCEPYCPEWIMAEGMIAPATPKDFQVTLAKARERSGVASPVIVLHSGGGNILAALQIGYFLRAQGVVTVVGKTSYKGCDPFDRTCTNPDADGIFRGRLVTGPASCLSACPLILAGGARRLAGSEAFVGVHHWGYEAEPGKPGKPIFKVPKTETAWDGVVRKMMSDYLTSMGISLDVIADMNKTPFAKMKLYDMKQRTVLKLINSTDAAQALASAKVCGSELRPGTCVLWGKTPDYLRSLVRVGVSSYDLPMSVTIVRDSRPDCEPVCQQWIAAKGAIRPETTAQFTKVLKKIGKSKLPVIIDSPGGDLDAALEIGRLIRKKGLDVVVSNMQFEGCSLQSPPCKNSDVRGLYRGYPVFALNGCRGVCVFVLAAGKQRLMIENASLMLHNSTLYRSRLASKTSVQQIATYLNDLGLGETAANFMTRIPADGRSERLVVQNAQNYNLITSPVDARKLFAADICRSSTPPVHCIRRN